MCCVDRKFRSSYCSAHFRIKPSICDHFGQDKITLICLLKIPDVCESWRGNVLVVRKDQGSEIVLKLKQFIVIWIFLKLRNRTTVNDILMKCRNYFCSLTCKSYSQIYIKTQGSEEQGDLTAHAESNSIAYGAVE